jgi:carnitine 3-dehydrogenase
LALETQLLGYDEKRVRLCHIMRGENGEVLATGEHMMLSVDTQAGKACPLEDPIPAKLAKIWEGHKSLSVPDFAGRAIREI